MPWHHFFDPTRFYTEIVYTALILVFCFVIYFKTRGIYELTKYKGIKYFRNAFLFFGLAYLVRLFLHLNLTSRIRFDMMPMRPANPLILVLIGYLSTMAIFFLVYSTAWKKIRENHFLLFSNAVAVLISFVSFITRSHMILIYLQFLLLILAILLSFAKKSRSRKHTSTRTLYILILFFWLFNLSLIGPREMVPFEVDMFFHLFSLVVFFIIFYKVSKWIK